MAAASGSSIARRVGKLSVENTAFFLCDIQDKFIPLISCSTTVVQTAQLLTSASKELKIPLVVTEQYRKVFGATYAQCFADPDHYASLASSIVDKKKFSMMVSSFVCICACLKWAQFVKALSGIFLSLLYFCRPQKLLLMWIL